MRLGHSIANGVGRASALASLAPSSSRARSTIARLGRRLRSDQIGKQNRWRRRPCGKGAGRCQRRERWGCGALRGERTRCSSSAPFATSARVVVVDSLLGL